MKRVLLIVLLVVLLLFGGAVGAFYLTPSSTIASAAAQSVRESTGRELTIEGEISRTLFPVLGVRTGKVTISNAEWAEKPVMVSADSAEFAVKLLPLLGGAVEIETIKLERPEVDLEVAEDGRRNWDFGPADGSGGGAGRGGGEHGGEGGGLPAVILKDARVTNGSFTFSDRQTGQRVALSDIEATVSLPALDRTMNIDASAMIEGKRATLSGALDSPAKAAAGENTLADVKFEAEGVSMGFNGSFRAPRDDAAPEASGDLAFKLDEDPQTTAWLREALPPELRELGGVDVTGKISASEAALDVSLNGDAQFKGQATQLRATATAAQGWMKGEAPAQVDVAAQNRLLDAGYAGTAGLSPSGEVALTGAWRLKVPDAPALYGWAGVSPPAGDPLAKLNSVDLTGDVDWGDDVAKATLVGGVGYNSRGVRLQGEVSGGQDWRTGGPINTNFTARSEGLFNFGWGGVVRLAEPGAPPAVEGAVRLTSQALREFADWAGAGPVEAPAGTFKSVALDTEVDVAKDRAALRNIVIHIDDAAVTGEVTVLTGGARPNISTTLQTGALDLRPFTRGGGARASGGASSGGASGGSSGGGWSEDPLELGVLKLVDVTFDITTDGLTTNVLRVGKSRIFGQLDNGRLETTVSEMALYGGSATGKAVVDARATPSVSLNVDATSVQMRPLLNDTAKVDNLEGTGAVGLHLTGQGPSVKAIMSSLNGDASMKVTDGAIIGVNLAAIVRNITSLGSASNQEEKTDFAEMSGTFKVANGVAANDDFTLMGPLVRMTGSGAIDIGQQTLDYRLEPKAVATIRGQGGPSDAKGLTFPVLVKGAWASPSVRPDLTGAMQNIETILQDPGAAADQLRSLGEGLGGGGDVGDAIRGLTGGGGGESGGGGGLQDAIRGLTGGGGNTAPAQGAAGADANAAPSGGGGGGLENAIRGLTGGGQSGGQSGGQDQNGQEQPSPGGLIKGLFGN